MTEFLRIEAIDGQLSAERFQLQRHEKAQRPTTGKVESVGVYWSIEKQEKIDQFIALGNELFFNSASETEAVAAVRKRNDDDEDARVAREAARVAREAARNQGPV